MSWFFAFTSVMVIGTFAFVGLMRYAMRTKLEEVESYFSENSEVRKLQQRWENQRFPRFSRMCLMIDILSMPKRHVKDGVVTEAELASVPLPLRRRFVWLFRLAIFLAAYWGYWCTWL
ncbi:hypothetical protein [Pseudomonas sp. NFPP28]|jgi:hypothetical protein|uniref:hypothetical protein n=1 Tax=Pseudomonas sp. NFPP28 TaxID=1566231 RepID=UPI0008EBC213|nr:hypothetical protein [Pseudomonas sp. NFPP28]SFP02017.1 hypothetical protein SAMN03159315_01489 [Pseudomonas sp. NFPP28]